MKIDITDRPGSDWDDFATAQRACSLGHASAWAAIFHESYGLKTHSLIARDENGQICGVLPLAEAPKLRGGFEMVSLPYLDGAGPLAVSASVEDALLERAQDIAVSKGAKAVELRTIAPEATEDPDFDRVDLVLELEADVEAQWAALRAKVRNQARKAEKSGLALIERSGAAQVDAFYEPFGVNMRDLGSPVHSRALFQSVAKVFGDACKTIVTADADQPVGGLIAIHYGDTVSVPWASTLRSERARCPNNQIYWEALRWAIERGAKRFDFGRSPRGEGTYRFKVGWGAVERPLRWQRFAPGGAEIALETASANPLLQRLSALWPRLPVPLANRLGPVLRRRISS